MRLPRWVHKAYANLFGYFWLPCPLCGKWFGGHEIGGSLWSISRAVCSDCGERAHALNLLELLAGSNQADYGDSTDKGVQGPGYEKGGINRMSGMTPDELRKEWIVGRYEDDPDRAFIAEIGGSICFVDDLTLRQADTIVTAYNLRRCAAADAWEAQVDQMNESYHRLSVAYNATCKRLEEAEKPIDTSTWFYKNCKRQRKNAAKICQVCPFRLSIEAQEAALAKEEK